MAKNYGMGGGYGQRLIEEAQRKAKAKAAAEAAEKRRRQQQNSIQAQAQRYIDAKIRAIEESKQAYLDELRRAAEERVSRGRDLATWMQGQNFPGRIQSIYQTAGSDITGYGSGFSQALQSQANADAAAVNNMLSGTGQEARNEGQGMGDVLYGAYAWSPARKFAETGAAFAADAANQPGFAVQFAQQEANDAYNEGLGALVDFAKEIADVKGSKFDIIQELKEQRMKQKLINQETGAKKKSEAQKRRDEKRERLQEEADRRTDQTHIIHEVRNGKVVNTGRPEQGYRIVDGVVVKDTQVVGPDGVVKTPDEKDKPSKPSPDERRRMTKEVLNAEPMIAEDVKLLAPKLQPRPVGPGGGRGKPELSQLQVLRNLYKKYKGLAGGVGAAQTTLRRIIRKYIRMAVAGQAIVVPDYEADSGSSSDAPPDVSN